VDRPSYSLIANLGLVPSDLSFEALELSRLADPNAVRARFPQLAGYTLLVSGDAHQLEEMQNRTMFKVQDLTITELRQALLGQNGRRVEVEERSL
jgi:PHP family Zn ribbon phosphoesterase